MSLPPPHLRLSEVFLADSPRPLQVEETGRGARAVLDPTGLNRPVVERWLERHGVSARRRKGPAGRELARSLAGVDTLVVCCDPRVRDLAETFARAVGAPWLAAGTPAEVAEALAASDRSSVTLFLLNDLLSEPLCHAVSAANRRRGAAGLRLLPYGFMTAFTPGHLAWLVVKTLVLLSGQAARRAVGFALYDGMTGTFSLHVRAAAGGRTVERETAEPWRSEEVLVLGVQAHGVSFDVQLGPVALCGHLDPPLPPARLAQAPACFHDGVCFRLGRSDQVQARFPAVEATPLVWWLNSCAAIPFAQSAFGNGTGYVYGLLAGAAVGVVGPFLTLPSTRWLNAVFEGLVATGATLGEAAAALSRAHDPEAGFDSYVLLGSPDLRLLPAAVLLPQQGEEPPAYRVRGKGQRAFRLALPPQLDHPAVLGDDGSDAWDGAGFEVIGQPGRREVLVVFERPADVDGWLRLGPAGRSLAEIGAEAEEIRQRLDVLANYPFVGEGLPGLEAGRAIARQLLALVPPVHLLRGRLYAAVLLVQLQEQLNRLQEAAAERFLDHVTAHDFSFDRESSNGFVPGHLRRSDRRCPLCGARLYSALDLCRAALAYRRRKDVCANCIGVAMVPEHSPVLVEPAGQEYRDGEVHVGLRLAGRAASHLRAWVAGCPRHGPRGTAGPQAVDLPPGGSVERWWSFPVGDRSGVISYRFLVLCQGSAEFHNFKYDNARG